jgi:multiple sugar transport system ATP-binding protein
MNFLHGTVASRDGQRVVLTEGGVALPLDGVAAEEGRPVVYGIRPEHIAVGPGGIPVEVAVLEPTGSETQIFGRLGPAAVDALVRDRISLQPGDTVPFLFDPGRAHIFDQASGQRL